MRALFAAVVFTAAVYGQSIQILSDAAQVLVGRTMEFQAIVRDAQGNPIPGGAVTWATNNALIATIDTRACVRPEFGRQLVVSSSKTAPPTGVRVHAETYLCNWRAFLMGVALSDLLVVVCDLSLS